MKTLEDAKQRIKEVTAGKTLFDLMSDEEMVGNDDDEFAKMSMMVGKVKE